MIDLIHDLAVEIIIRLIEGPIAITTEILFGGAS